MRYSLNTPTFQIRSKSDYSFGCRELCRRNDFYEYGDCRPYMFDRRYNGLSGYREYVSRSQSVWTVAGGALVLVRSCNSIEKVGSNSLCTEIKLLGSHHISKRVIRFRFAVIANFFKCSNGFYRITILLKRIDRLGPKLFKFLNVLVDWIILATTRCFKIARTVWWRA